MVHIFSNKYVKIKVGYYRPQRSWGKVMFSQACVILFMGGVCLPQCMLGYTPWEQTPPPDQAPPPWDQAPPPGTRQTPGADTPPTRHPPWCRACWEIRSSRGRYASYWNVILLLIKTFGLKCVYKVTSHLLKGK